MELEPTIIFGRSWNRSVIKIIYPDWSTIKSIFRIRGPGKIIDWSQNPFQDSKSELKPELNSNLIRNGASSERLQFWRQQNADACIVSVYFRPFSTQILLRSHTSFWNLLRLLIFLDWNTSYRLFEDLFWILFNSILSYTCGIFHERSQKPATGCPQKTPTFVSSRNFLNCHQRTCSDQISTYVENRPKAQKI